MAMAAPTTEATGKVDMAPILQQLNLTPLRNRMHDLQATISRITHAIHTNPSTKWPDVLGQFAIVNLELLSLVDDIKPILKAFVVHPKNVSAATASILPIMLSSKLLPEMEAEEAGLKEQVLTPLSNLPLHVQTDRLQKQIELVRTVCDSIDKVLSDSRKNFGLGARQGQPPLTTIDKVQAARILEQEKLLHAAANFGEGLRISSDQRNMTLVAPPHIASALASTDDGNSRPSSTLSGVMRPATPQQINPGSANAAPAPGLTYATSPRPGVFNDIQSQQQAMIQKSKLQLMQKQMMQQQQQQTLRSPMSQMQVNPSGSQPLLHQTKIQQFPPQSHLQLNQQQHAQLQQHIQERNFQQYQLQQLHNNNAVGSQTQGSPMRPYGNAQASLLSPNMVANTGLGQTTALSQRMQFGTGLTSQPQRGQMITDPLYMGSNQSGTSLSLPQANYPLINPNQNPLLNSTTSNNILGTSLLNQNTLLNANTMPFGARQQQQPPPSQ